MGIKAADISRMVINQIFSPVGEAKLADPPDIVDWLEECFFVTETRRPIVLQPVQKVVLRMFFERGADGKFIWQTGLYSTIKKSGKTTIAAGVMQWCAETWGDYGEIYHMGNKLKQAKERAFKLMKYSIQLSPRTADWELQETQMKHLSTHSIVQALPVNAAGEAGGNQRLTTWTEFHGYVHETDERMWDELQPVPTQLLSFRFLESYAGFVGESNLLKKFWDRAKAGIRLHDEYPIYGVPEDGLIAYIDEGADARRMPWQTPEYYVHAEANERPQTYRRIHLNEWVTSQNAFVNIALWDALEMKVERPNYEGGKLRVVAGVDASKSGDCTAVSVWCWHKGIPVEIETHIFEPPKGGTIDYAETIKPALDGIRARHKLVCIAYDEYQLHHFMNELEKQSEYRAVAFREFGQGQERVKADTDLELRIRQGTLGHSGNHELRQHVQNADSKDVGDSALRIIKRDPLLKIDGVIAGSMAAYTAAQVLATMGGAGVARQAKHNLYQRERRR